MYFRFTTYVKQYSTKKQIKKSEFAGYNFITTVAHKTVNRFNAIYITDRIENVFVSPEYCGFERITLGNSVSCHLYVYHQFQYAIWPSV